MAEPQLGGSGGGGSHGSGDAEPECRNDSHCAMGTACDGEERCVAGACSPGVPIQCSHGTACYAQAVQGPCVYEEPSPWLLITSSDRIVGLPRAQLAHEPLLILAEREGATFNTAYFKTQWSPTGDNALAFAYEAEQGMSLARFRFGAGLPERAPLDEVPTWFDVGYDEVTALFSHDGARLAVDRTGLFLVQLEGTPAATRRVQSHAKALCAEPDSWLSSTGIVSLLNGDLKEQALAGEAYPSPDGRWVIEAGASGRLWACAASGTPLDVGAIGKVLWSADSRYVVNELEDGGLRILSLLDPAAPTEVWAHAAARQYGFAESGDGIVVKLTDAETYSWLSLLGSDSAAARDLSLPADACVIGVAAELLLARWPCEDELAEVVWLPLHAPAQPEVLSTGSVLSYDPELGIGVLDPGSGEELRLLQIDERGQRLQPLFRKNEDHEYQFYFSPDAKGLVVVTVIDIENVVDFYPIDPATGDLQAKVSLAVDARAVGWQPWR